MKYIQGISIAAARIEQRYQAMIHHLVQIVQYLMAPQNRETFSHSGQEYDCLLRRIPYNVIDNQTILLVETKCVGNSSNIAVAEHFPGEFSSKSLTFFAIHIISSECLIRYGIESHISLPVR